MPTEPPTTAAVPNTDSSLSTSANTDKSTDPDTDMPAQNDITPNSESVNTIAPAVGGAVGGLIVVIVVIAVVVIALLFIKRGQQGSVKMNDKKGSLQAYNNAIYDGKQN